MSVSLGCGASGLTTWVIAAPLGRPNALLVLQDFAFSQRIGELLVGLTGEKVVEVQEPNMFTPSL